jgi:hypothetical protein
MKYLTLACLLAFRSTAHTGYGNPEALKVEDDAPKKLTFWE